MERCHTSGPSAPLCRACNQRISGTGFAFTQNGLGSPSASARGGIARHRSGGKLPLLPIDNSSQFCCNPCMKQTMLLKLAPSPEQHTALLETMHAFNAGANYVAEVAFMDKTANKVDLQKLVYGTLRVQYHLPAQLAIRCISKASEAYKRDKSIKPEFRSEGAIIYDERVMSFKGLNQVSLLTLSGRVLVPLRIGEYQQSRLDSIKGQADLLYRKGAWYMAVTLDVPARHSSWAFAQLPSFLFYKARLAGVPLHTVDPAYTSRTCSRPECGHCEKANRKSRSEFVCQKCGHAMNADINAAINISRAAVMQLIVSPGSRFGCHQIGA
jgi:predicted transposase